jgi:hypothetical protein
MLTKGLKNAVELGKFPFDPNLDVLVFQDGSNGAYFMFIMELQCFNAHLLDQEVSDMETVLSFKKGAVLLKKCKMTWYAISSGSKVQFRVYLCISAICKTRLFNQLTKSCRISASWLVIFVGTSYYTTHHLAMQQMPKVAMNTCKFLDLVPLEIISFL